MAVLLLRLIFLLKLTRKSSLNQPFLLLITSQHPQTFCLEYVDPLRPLIAMINLNSLLSGCRIMIKQVSFKSTSHTHQGPVIRCFSPSSGLTHLVLLGPPDDVCGEFLSSLSDGGNCHLYDVWSSKTDSKGNFLPN